MDMQTSCSTIQGNVSPTENIVGDIPPNKLLLNKLFKMFNAYIFYKNVIEEIIIELLI